MDFNEANNTCLGIDNVGIKLFGGIKYGELALYYAARSGGKSNIVGGLFESISLSMVESKLMKSKSKQSRMVKVKIGE